jgi:hypothetical protein
MANMGLQCAVFIPSTSGHRRTASVADRYIFEAARKSSAVYRACGKHATLLNRPFYPHFMLDIQPERASRWTIYRHRSSIERQTISASSMRYASSRASRSDHALGKYSPRAPALPRILVPPPRSRCGSWCPLIDQEIIRGHHTCEDNESALLADGPPTNRSLRGRSSLTAERPSLLAFRRAECDRIIVRSVCLIRASDVTAARLTRPPVEVYGQSLVLSSETQQLALRSGETALAPRRGPMPRVPGNVPHLRLLPISVYNCHRPQGR